MNEVLNAGNILDGTSENAKMMLTEFGKGQQTIEILIASIVVGVLLCLFGLKLVRVLTALTGFLIGAMIGLVVSVMMELTGMTMVIVIFACAVILALLAFFLYRVGIFFLMLEMAAGIAMGFIDVSSMIQLLVALVIGVVVAVLAVIYIEPVVIIITAISGGIGAGTAIAQVAGIDSNPLIVYGISALLAIVGMVVQFMMQSRKVGKKEKIYSDKVRKDVSVESEVEKARTILDDEDSADDGDENEDNDDIEIIDNFEDDSKN